MTADLVARAHEFHKSRLTEYLYPREQAFFEKLADQRALFAALEGTNVVCICYVLPEREGMILEFGGVCIDASAEGLGVAAALGRCALISEFARNAPLDGAKLIAHVHSENDKPRPLLERLGFTQTGSDVYDMPPEVTMKRNAEGKVPGDLFEFPFERLAALAKWLADFDPAKREGVEIVIEVPFMESRDAALAALHDIAKGYRSKP